MFHFYKIKLINLKIINTTTIANITEMEKKKNENTKEIIEKTTINENTNQTLDVNSDKQIIQMKKKLQ